MLRVKFSGDARVAPRVSGAMPAYQNGLIFASSL